jgi:hypothetical protein
MTVFADAPALLREYSNLAQAGFHDTAMGSLGNVSSLQAYITRYDRQNLV